MIDSLASLARAINAHLPASERVLTGGITAEALRETRRSFGLGRAFEPAGSLTVIATATVDSGSELDDVVFQELVGTGNSEIRLDATAIEANASLISTSFMSSSWRPARSTAFGIASVGAMPVSRGGTPTDAHDRTTASGWRLCSCA